MGETFGYYLKLLLHLLSLIMLFEAVQLTFCQAWQIPQPVLELVLVAVVREITAHH